MLTQLRSVSSDCYKLIYSGEGKREETLELVVPDRCADVGRILDVRCQIFQTGKKIKDGEAHISSQAEVCVIFSAEGSGEPEYVNAKLSFHQQFTLGTDSDKAELSAQSCVDFVNARALNPRKLLIRAACLVKLCCFVPEEFVLWDDFKSEDAQGVHTLSKSVSHQLITGIREKSFSISDEYILPDAFSQAKMLFASTQLSLTDAKTVGNKLVFKADANTVALFAGPKPNKVVKYDMTTQFSQLIEIDSGGDGTESIVLLQLKEAQFVSLPERDGACYSARFSVDVQALCTQTVCSDYVADAYSNLAALTPVFSDVQLSTICPVERVRLASTGRTENLQTLEYMAISSVFCQENDGCISVRAELTGLGLSLEGELVPAELSLSAQSECLSREGYKLKLLGCFYQSVCLEQDGQVSGAVWVDYLLYSCDCLEAVSAAEIDDCACGEECPPALTVLVGPGSDDLWSLAKAYGSTMELIKTVNALEQEACPVKRPLLIPRA